MRGTIGRAAGFAVVLGVLGMLPPAARLAAQATAEAPATSPGPDALVPAGFGTLNQSDIEVRFTTDELEIRFVPLDERVTRLLANDAYQALHGLVRARHAAVEAILDRSGVSRPGRHSTSSLPCSATTAIRPMVMPTSAIPGITSRRRR